MKKYLGAVLESCLTLLFLTLSILLRIKSEDVILLIVIYFITSISAISTLVSWIEIYEDRKK